MRASTHRNARARGTVGCTVALIAVFSACGRIRFIAQPRDAGDRTGDGSILVDGSQTDADGELSEALDAIVDAGADLGVDTRGDAIDAVDAADAPDVAPPMDAGQDAPDAALDVPDAPDVLDVPDVAVDPGASDSGIDSGPDVVDAPPDVPVPPFYMRVSKLTAAAPWMAMGTFSPGDCGAFQFTHFLATASVEMGSDERIPSTYLDRSGSMVWFFYSCKYTDNGWSYGVASWTPGDASPVRYDHDVGLAGIQAQLEVHQPASDGQNVVSLQHPHVVMRDDGSIVGTVERYNLTASLWTRIRFGAATPPALDPFSLDVATDGVHTPPTLAWTTLTSARIDYVRSGTSVYGYVMGWDGSSRSAASNVPDVEIGVVEYDETFSTPTWDPTPIVRGWLDPMVTRVGSTFHMVARRADDDRYYYIRGTGLRTFDFARAEPLYLHRFEGVPGDWDGDYYSAHQSGDPKVFGARVIDDVMYVFYLAGPETGPYSWLTTNRGAIGIFTFPVVP